MSATTEAVSVVAICAIVQLTLLFCSISHPSISDWVTISFVITVALYPIVFAFHAKQIKACKERSAESPADLN